MKKTVSMLLILVLCLGMLTGCARKPAAPQFPKDAVPASAPAPTEEPAAEPSPAPSIKPYVPPTDERGGAWDLVPFDEMPYERPALDTLRTNIEAVGQALDSGTDYDALEPLLDACWDEQCAFYTMYSIAFIRSCQDTTDTFYADEYAWLDEQSAELEQLMEKFFFRCGMSDMALELEEKYFWPGFAEEYADDSTAFYDDEMVALLQQEANLVAEYRELVANPIVKLEDGSEVEYYTGLDQLQGFALVNLLFGYYEQFNPELGRVYIELIKNRQQQAAAAGYDSYEALAFDHSFQRDYSPELAEEYLQGIKEHIVPLYREASLTDVFYSYDPGSIDAQRLEQVLRQGVSDMGQDVQDTYEFMVKYRLCDLEYSPYKAEMSFQTYLDSYEVPFLFMDAAGGLDDITTFSHEFGHYLDGYLNFNADETIDLAECFSQAMELLMLTHLDDVLTEKELASLYQIKMGDILGMYVQQGAFAEFEHILYNTAPEDLTLDYVNTVFLNLTKDYGSCESGYESFYSMLWIDITHFFEQPFYVITYPVSHDIAMQIFQLEQADPGEGLAKFLDMLPREYPDMLDSALNAGLESPFDPGRLEKVAATMREILLPDTVENAA